GPDRDRIAQRTRTARTASGEEGEHETRSRPPIFPFLHHRLPEKKVPAGSMTNRPAGFLEVIAGRDGASEEVPRAVEGARPDEGVRVLRLAGPLFRRAALGGEEEADGAFERERRD